MEGEIRLDPGPEQGVRGVALTGDWTFSQADLLERKIASVRGELEDAKQLRFDCAGLLRLDTAGAWVLTKCLKQLRGDGHGVELAGCSEGHRRLLERLADYDPSEPPRRREATGFLVPFIVIGEIVEHIRHDMIAASAVLGRVLTVALGTVTFRSKFRFPAFVTQLDRGIVGAVPIVALISFVVGAIVTQQSILPLKNFGATIFVVNLSAILMLREIGVLLAAIMVAGRSGSAITAELGAMRMREEVDALTVMGLDPYEVLLLPRILALMVGLPFLAFIGAIAGLCGAALVAQVFGGIPIYTFLVRLQGALSIQMLLVGLIKAPFMAFIIGLVASVEGMRVEGSAESLGRHATASVVKSIFMVIVADGLFAMFFASIGF